MHALELADLAVNLAESAPALLAERPDLAGEDFYDYWVASKCRLDCWALRIRSFKSRDNSEPSATPDDAHRAIALLEEIVASEVLTRVWTAVVTASTGADPRKPTAPMVRSIYLGHLEARYRALRMLLDGKVLNHEQSLRTNLLRRQAERWSDLLLGYLTQDFDVGRFAFDGARCRQFGADLARERRRGEGEHAWTSVVAGVRAAVAQRTTVSAANPQLNLRIAESILAMMPLDLTSTTPVVHVQLVARLMHAADDAQGMLGELFAAERLP